MDRGNRANAARPAKAVDPPDSLPGSMPLRIRTILFTERMRTREGGTAREMMRNVLRKLGLSREQQSVVETAAIDEISEAGDRALRWVLSIESILLTAVAASTGEWLPVAILGLSITALFYVTSLLYPAAIQTRVAAAIALQVAAVAGALIGAGPVELAILTMVQISVLLLYRDPAPVWTAAGAYVASHIFLVWWAEPASMWHKVALPLAVLPHSVICASVAAWLRKNTTHAARIAEELELKEQALSEALFDADKATRAKSDFLANLSHEVRTPVNGVLGMTHLLLDTRLTAEQRELARTLERSSKALLEVINEVLDFSRIDAGKLVVQKQGFSFASPFEDVLELLGPIAVGKGLELLCDLDARIPVEVVGDARRLRQVLLNVVGNALKFTEHGHILIHTTLEEDKENSVVIRTEVTDTGPGITDEEQQKLFQPFSQGSGDVVRKYGGTGLGLAISKRLVEMMSGEIGVRSVPGKGARFWFTVECARTKNEKFLQLEGLSGKRVLVLCRYSHAAIVTAGQLKQWGLEAFAAFHADTAIAELMHAQQAGRPYDAVFIEGEERGPHSSYSWRERISKVGRIPAVGILPYGEWEVMDDERHAGFDALVTKPLRASRILAALRTALQGVPDEGAEAILPAVNAPDRALCDVLLVEDNLINQRVALSMLRKLGYRVDVASDGKQALEALERSSYTVVLMDCMMPVMDGFEATAAIRKSERGRRTPIIAMTAYAMPGDKDRCLAAGMDDYVSKPVDWEQLRNVMERWGQLRSAAAGGE